MLMKKRKSKRYVLSMGKFAVEIVRNEKKTESSESSNESLTKFNFYRMKPSNWTAFSKRFTMIAIRRCDVQWTNHSLNQVYIPLKLIAVNIFFCFLFCGFGFVQIHNVLWQFDNIINSVAMIKATSDIFEPTFQKILSNFISFLMILRHNFCSWIFRHNFLLFINF